MSTGSSSITMTASQAFTGPSTGFVILGPDFVTKTITLSSTFAADLYALLGSPLLTLYTYDIIFSMSNSGYFFYLTTADTNIITSNSYKFTQNGGLINGPSQGFLFVLTQISPPQFTVYDC